jgi:hypothetical protein
MPELAESTDGLHPAEDFFDAFAHTLADVVARVPRGPSVQGATLLKKGAPIVVRSNRLVDPVMSRFSASC